MHNTEIRRRRKAAGLTQAQLAEKVGTDQPTVARLERHGIEHLRRIAGELGCKVADLLG